jgi:hypothetical protein
MIIQSIKDAFSELGVELSEDWLAALEVVHDGPLTNDSVYSALMLSDLRESCIASHSHPLSTSSFRNTTCMLPSGSFLFQITTAVDISIPDAHRPRQTSSTRRMLRMVLQYGSISLNAVEIETLPDLPDNPDAGMKVIVCGSPMYHNHILLLKAGNLQVVGGEIPALALAQAQETESRLKMRDPLVYRPPSREIHNR